MLHSLLLAIIAQPSVTDLHDIVLLPTATVRAASPAADLAPGGGPETLILAVVVGALVAAVVIRMIQMRRK